MTQMSATEVAAFLGTVFPEVRKGGHDLQMLDIGTNAHGQGTGRMRLAYSDAYLRPGGTISGPSLFLLADVAAYATLLGQIGPVPLAVTTSMHITFLSRATPGDVVADLTIKKLGKRLAVIVGDLYREADGAGRPIAQATATYALPPEAQGS